MKKTMTAALMILIAAAGAAAGEKKKKPNPPPLPPAAAPQPQPARQKPANGSLFTDDARNSDLTSDFKPQQVGDIVFIDVAESNAASVSSGAKQGRDSGNLGGVIVGVAPLPNAIVGAAGAAVGALGTSKFEGKGSTERKSQILARIAGRVVEVYPNGDLRIEAEKSLIINKETEKLKLYGIVRRRDISRDNSVSTASVADLLVELNGKGVASANNGPGWLTRFFQRISPF